MDDSLENRSVAEDPLQEIITFCKSAAIVSKKLVAEVADNPKNVPNLCQEAEKSAFLVLVGIVDLEKKGLKDEEGVSKRVQDIAKAAEELYKLVINLTDLSTQYAGLCL